MTMVEELQKKRRNYERGMCLFAILIFVLLWSLVSEDHSLIWVVVLVVLQREMVLGARRVRDLKRLLALIDLLDKTADNPALAKIDLGRKMREFLQMVGARKGEAR